MMKSKSTIALSAMSMLVAIAGLFTESVAADNGVGGAYGGRYTAYGAALASEASVTKSYAIAIFSWAYMGLYIGLAILGVALTWFYFHIASGSGASANQVTTIVTATVIAFVLLLLLVMVFTSWALGVVTP